MLHILINLKKIFLIFKNFLKKIVFLRKIKLLTEKKLEKIYKLCRFYIFFPKQYRKFLDDKKKFKSLGGNIDEIREAIYDFDTEAGIAKGHYFNQDLLVANFIFKENPERHIDIGSRIDGFIAHLAAFRKVEVMDIRKLRPTSHENIMFIQNDIMNEENTHNEICDSISSLHALEHFGLGRYNDKLDPSGHLLGFKNMVKMLKVNGKLYISFPIGKKKLVFNQRRVFSYDEILNWNKNLSLIRFDYVDDNGNLFKNSPLKSARQINYGCGIYTFIKTK